MTIYLSSFKHWLMIKESNWWKVLAIMRYTKRPIGAIQAKIWRAWRPPARTVRSNGTVGLETRLTLSRADICKRGLNCFDLIKLNLMALIDLPESLREVLTEKLKYSELSEIQQLVVNHFSSANANANIIAKSKNGTGKSLALTICVIKLLNQLSPVNLVDPESEVVHPEALILAPSREIAI
jgi:hypothetical protein